MAGGSLSSLPALIDVRPEAEFLAGHAGGAVGIPLEELPDRVHELPPADVALWVTDSDPRRSRQAAEFLRQRGHPTEIAVWDPARLTERGPARTHLWRPNPFLLEALSYIKSEQSTRPGRALDVACGSGRDAVHLALQGYDVCAIDLLPDALQRAGDLARRSGVHIRTIVVDLERDPSLPPGRFDLVSVFRYLQRGLFPTLREAVEPGGYIVYETFHEQNRQTGRRPQNPAHLLQTGELLRAFDGFDVLISRDAFERDGRFFSALLARRTGS